MSYIFLLILGICFIILGVFNFKGNIASIHWYNRTKITKENVKNYGKVMGTGTMIIGISMIVTAILQMIFNIEKLWYIITLGLTIGLILMFYSQIKYNKGIF